MKKIYTIIFVSCLAAISFSSCSDWLDVRPADEIRKNICLRQEMVIVQL